MPDRPDLTVQGQPPLVTDFCVCAQQGDVGIRAKEHEQTKNEQHQRAVANQGHVFVPFVAEVHGHLGHAALKFAQKASDNLLLYQRNTFVNHLRMATSVALAKARTQMAMAYAVDRHAVAHIEFEF